jgi:pyruvate/2-oxoglutarate dehydrogenase complex dihydrolipoamide acyltransferase (E2) component
MRTVFYTGPYEEGVEIPLPTGEGIHVLPGEPAEVPDEVAEGLLLQEDVWKAEAKAPKAPPAPSESVVALAEERGIDLTKVEGSGAGGRIVKKDVEAAVATAAKALAGTAGDETEPAEGTTNEEE